MAEILVILFVAFCFIMAIVTSKKDPKNTPNTSQRDADNSCNTHYESELEALFQELVRIGHESLTSSGMTKDEKINIMEQVIESLLENTTEENGKKYMNQIMKKAYDSLQNKFSIDSQFCQKIAELSYTFDVRVTNKTLYEYGWAELIDLVEEEEKKPVLQFVIKGLWYRTEAEKDAAYCLKVGEELVLKRQPRNKYDPFAVKVMTTDGYHIGYVEAGLSQEVSSRMDDIIRCQLTVSKIIYDGLYLEATILFRK